MSTIAVDNARPSAGGTSYSLTSGVAKAWVSYDQTVPETESSLNVSSVSDDGTGDYSINYTNSFSSVDYGAGGSSDLNPGGFSNAFPIGSDAKAAGSIDMRCRISNTASDRRNFVTAHGDLA